LHLERAGRQPSAQAIAKDCLGNSLEKNQFGFISARGPEVDGLRCIAIIAVVFLHCYSELLNRIAMGKSFGANSIRDTLPSAPTLPGDSSIRLISHGGGGVEVFFAISGFVLALPFARQYLLGDRTVRLGAYFMRRLTRLEPPYILALLIRSALLLATGLRQTHFLLVHLLASIFYSHSLVFGVASTIEPVAWTLEIEVQFYCLVPLLALIYKTPRAWLRRTALLALIVCATPLQQAFLPGWHGPRNLGAFNLSILGSIQFFLVGFLVADLYIDSWESIPNTWLWDAITIPLWFLFFWMDPLRTYRWIAPVILPLLFIGAFKGYVVSKIVRNPLITTVGGMCYSIYLTHRTTILALQILLVYLHLKFLVWLIVSLLVVAPISIAVGAIYFLLIERPCMDPRWPQRLIQRLRNDPETEPALVP
jgi:peptidoglycan/LPS O-acetylase OafA/YrhL